MKVGGGLPWQTEGMVNLRGCMLGLGVDVMHWDMTVSVQGVRMGSGVCYVKLS